jgi:hypothetical protein
MGHSTDARRMMHRGGFNDEKVRLALIWAAKWTRCPKCDVAIGKPCENLNERMRGIKKPTVNPHSERIDWEMLVHNLKARGFH